MAQWGSGCVAVGARAGVEVAKWVVWQWGFGSGCVGGSVWSCGSVSVAVGWEVGLWQCVCWHLAANPG